jgi:hypothetical protein
MLRLRLWGTDAPASSATQGTHRPASARCWLALDAAHAVMCKALMLLRVATPCTHTHVRLWSTDAPASSATQGTHRPASARCWLAMDAAHALMGVG